MNRTNIKAACLVLATVGLLGTAGCATAPEPVVEIEPAPALSLTRQSVRSFDETLVAIKDAIAARSLKVFAEIDHQTGAASIDSDIAPNTLIIFGSPKLGTPLLKSDSSVGFSLPMRIQVSSDETGVVSVSVTNPKRLAFDHDLESRAALVAQIERNMSFLLQEVTDPPR